MSDDAVKKLLEKTKNFAINGELEPFKITTIHDGTARNLHWMGEEPERFQKMMS